jgi:drug/metabolite transporter (DMT)-like permease
MPKLPAFLSLSGRAYLLIAIIIFGASNAVTRRLTDLGAENLIDGRNPISFCNVLFVGNLCALTLLTIIYRRQLQPAVLRQITPPQWLTLTVNASLSAAVVPMLIFMALSITAVNNVILIGQIDTPIALALAVILLGERVNRWVVIGAVLAFVGVTLTVLLQAPSTDMVAMGDGLVIGRGELMTLIAAVLLAVSNLVSKRSLQSIPLGLFNVYRTLVGTIVFFIVTIAWLGPSHFMDVTSPFLWQWMLIYSAVIVVGGQLAWFNGLRQSSASEISLATAFEPLAGVFAAFLILGEVPTIAQYMGGAVILAGIALNHVGLQKLTQTQPAAQPTPAEMSDQIIYKGI